MKKTLSIALCICMLCSMLVGCTKAEEPAANESSKKESVQTSSKEEESSKPDSKLDSKPDSKPDVDAKEYVTHNKIKGVSYQIKSGVTEKFLNETEYHYIDESKENMSFVMVQSLKDAASPESSLTDTLWKQKIASFEKGLETADDYKLLRQAPNELKGKRAHQYEYTSTSSGLPVHGYTVISQSGENLLVFSLMSLSKKPQDFVPEFIDVLESVKFAK
ncbi:MAG: hypothetical protein RSA79_04310 [Oscillospiraceae bacterium]